MNRASVQPQTNQNSVEPSLKEVSAESAQRPEKLSSMPAPSQQLSQVSKEQSYSNTSAPLPKSKQQSSDVGHRFVSTVAAALDAKGTKQSQQLAAQLYNSILEHRTATAKTFAAVGLALAVKVA